MPPDATVPTSPEPRATRPVLRLRTAYRYGLYGLLLAILLVFLVWPIALTVRGGFIADGAFTLDYFVGEGVGVLRDPLYRTGLINSVGVAVFTTLLCLLIAMPLAMLAAKFEFFGKTLLSSLVLVPLILPPFVGAIGLRAILGRFGSLNALLGDVGVLSAQQPGVDFLGGELGGRFWAVVVMQALHLYPILYLNVTAALANLDPSLDEAATGLGAGRVKRFVRCTLPLIMPGLFAGSTIVFIWSFTELGTPLMFDYYRVTPVQVFWGINEISDNPRPYALVVVMLAAAVGMYLLGKFAFGGRAYEMQSKAVAGAGVRRLRGWRAGAAAAAFLAITAVSVLPHLGVVLQAFSVEGAWYRSVLPRAFTLDHFGQALRHDLAMGSIANSLLYAVLAMIVCIAVGLAIAYLTVRVKVKGGVLLDALGMLPLAVPGLVLAFGFVAMSLAWPFPQIAAFFQNTLAAGDTASLAYRFGAAFQVVGQSPNPILFLVIAYAVRRLPYILRSASAGLEQTSGQLEEAALNLGAKPATAIRRVVVPPHHGQPHRRRHPRLLLLHARSQRLAHPRAERRTLPHHQGHLGPLPPTRRRTLHRLRHGRLGHAPAHRHPRRRQRPDGQEARGHLPRLTPTTTAATPHHRTTPPPHRAAAVSIAAWRGFALITTQRTRGARGAAE